MKVLTDMQKEYIRRKHSDSDGLEQCYAQEFDKYSCCAICKEAKMCQTLTEELNKAKEQIEKDANKWGLTEVQINDIVRKTGDYVRNLLEENNNVSDE